MMAASTTIAQQGWMKEADILSVMNALNKKNQSHALIVGGAVRNALLGFPVADIDIATVHTPDKIMEILNEKKIRVIPTGIDHGTVTAVVKGRTFEITTLRRDVETTGRRAVVAFTTDWAEDAARRDFTMNTLLADLGGHIYDPLGQGLADLEARRVRFVGQADERIQEDYLRILRFFRFHARYGKGKPDAGAIAACAKYADDITRLSRERITQEFMGILTVDNPVDILGLMFVNKVLADLPHAGYQPERLAMLAKKQKKADAVDALARLAVLCAFDAGHIAHLEKCLTFSGKQKQALTLLCKVAAQELELTEKSVRLLIYQYGNEAARQAVLLSADAHPESLYDFAASWAAPEFPISGDDLKLMGVPPGPAMGRTLKAAEEWWMEHDFTPSRDNCIDHIIKGLR